MSTIKAKIMAFVLLAGTAFVSTGCMSMRHTTNIKPPPNAATLSLGRQFRLESVKRVNKDGSEAVSSLPYRPPESPADINEINRDLIWDDAKWLAEMSRTAQARYPAIFAEGQRAYPLSVVVRVKGDSPSIALVVSQMLLSGLVLGGLLPLYAVEKSDIEVCPELLLDGGMVRVPLATVGFELRSGVWITVFTPLGLIPVPGRADKRDIQNVLPYIFGDAIPPPPANGYALNVESCVDALVLSLQSSEEQIRRALAGQAPGINVTAP